MIFFKEIFTTTYITAGLLLSRGLSYYLIIIMGGIVMAFAQITRKKRVLEVRPDTNTTKNK